MTAPIRRHRWRIVAIRTRGLWRGGACADRQRHRKQRHAAAVQARQHEVAAEQHDPARAEHRRPDRASSTARSRRSTSQIELVQDARGRRARTARRPTRQSSRPPRWRSGANGTSCDICGRLLRRARRALAAELVSQYEQPQQSLVSVIVTSSGFQQLLDQLEVPVGGEAAGAVDHHRRPAPRAATPGRPQHD